MSLIRELFVGSVDRSACLNLVSLDYVGFEMRSELFSISAGCFLYIFEGRGGGGLGALMVCLPSCVN